MIVGTISVLNYRASIQFYLEDQKQELRLIATAVTGAMGKIWEIDGKESALVYLKDEDERRPRSELTFLELTDTVPSLSPPRPLVETTTQLVLVHGEVRGKVFFVRSSLEFESFAREELYRQLIIGALATLLGSLFILLFTRRQISQPLGELSRLTENIATGTLVRDAHRVRHDEIGSLAGSLHRMSRALAVARDDVARAALDRDLLFEMMRERDRDGTAGYLAAEFAHELGSPLNVVAGRAEMILDDNAGTSKTAENAKVIIEQVRRMTHVIAQRLEDLRPHGERQEGPIGEFLRRVETVVSPLLSYREIALRVDTPPPSYRLEVDASRFVHVLASLLLVVARVSPGSSSLELAVSRESVSTPLAHEGRPGPGFAVIVRSTAVEPTDKLRAELERGNGLGLTVRACRDAMAAEDGWVSWSLVEGQGLEFTVFVPENQAAEA